MLSCVVESKYAYQTWEFPILTSQVQKYSKIITKIDIVNLEVIDHKVIIINTSYQHGFSLAFFFSLEKIDLNKHPLLKTSHAMGHLLQQIW